MAVLCCSSTVHSFVIQEKANNSCISIVLILDLLDMTEESAYELYKGTLEMLL